MSRMDHNHLKSKDLPKVSVIAPVYNGQESISGLIESLLAQTYPEELLEIFIVDNGSFDQTPEIIQKYPVQFLEEKERQSSYAARNLGLRHATGDIYAFIDADCQASEEWIFKGVTQLQSESADLVAGRVKFTFSDSKTHAEIYDAITHMQIDKIVAKDKVAVTANLMTKAELFNTLGPFDDSVVSGSDHAWTQKATQHGFKLIYCAEAFVEHPARNLGELLKKRFRVGKGALRLWRSQGRSTLSIMESFIKPLIPIKPSIIKKRIEERSAKNITPKLVPTWWIDYLCRISGLLGMISSLFRLQGKGRS